ncbi:MAG: TIGR02466 family protein [Steroidobacteraceae bacterium]
MSTRSLFPTQVYVAPLMRQGLAPLNARLLQECLQLREDDVAGQRWSARSYPGGFTSYNTQCRMHRISPTFALLEKRLARHVRRFVAELELDLSGRELAMTDCWVNIMPPAVVHSLHLHPLSTLSGTYYVRTPRGSPALKFEDPRLDRFMAAPPRRADCRPEHRPWAGIPAETGNVVLFESWLRHEVPPNTARSERISISFNYSWF